LFTYDLFEILIEDLGKTNETDATSSSSSYRGVKGISVFAVLT